MAPPIPGLRQPVQVRHRTPGDVLAGVGAVILLTALTVGVPIALITVVGLPLPHTLPKLSALTSQLDITAILRILSVVVWPAWIQLVWCVLVEIEVAASEKSGHAATRPKVPLAGATQSLAHRLVTAALLLFTAAAALTPAVISHGPHGPGIQAVTPKLAGEVGLGGHPSQRSADGGDAELPVVQAPGGPVRDNGIWASPATTTQQAAAWPYELSAASLLAAGVLVALGRKRREQLWRRAFDGRIAGPDPDAALAEKALRLGADDPAVRMLDTGLRYL